MNMEPSPHTDPMDLKDVFLDAENPRIYTVTELNREIRNLLEAKYYSVWVEGEISNFKRHTSGHIYFTLKDESSQIGAVFFSRWNRLLKFEPRSGLHVIAAGRVSIYEARGQYQLYVERLEPKGLGALQLAFLQLKEKLEKEGLFDKKHKKAIPPFPRTVGVITSSTGAAIRDILNVVNRRFHGTEVLIYPVRVQGDGASAEIAEAVDAMNEVGGIDVLIVGRGGGSLEDLWAFNEEVVARAVFRSRIPVISAVGHEIDWTICDLVADLRAPTPSAAAELVVQSREELENRLRDYQARIAFAVKSLLDSKKSKLKRLRESYAFQRPLYLMDQFSQKLDELLRQLQNYAKALISQRHHEFRGLAGKLHALSPLAILERGYSVTFDSRGQVVKSADKLRKGETVRTWLARGSFSAVVQKIDPKKKEKGGVS